MSTLYWVIELYAAHWRLENSIVFEVAAASQCVNPLLHIGHNIVRMAKISILKFKGIPKSSHERCVY